MPAYKRKARLLEDLNALEQYKLILDKDVLKDDIPHWHSMSKSTITLFQVLIDNDLTHLVMLLEHYPRYTQAVCEHFRYAYSYSEIEADIGAVSELLFKGEPYFTKQFVRNVVRKLPKCDDYSIKEIGALCEQLAQNNHHDIVLNHYHDTLSDRLSVLNVHPLQSKVVEKKLHAICVKNVYDYKAADRDAQLDIPYMY